MTTRLTVEKEKVYFEQQKLFNFGDNNEFVTCLRVLFYSQKLNPYNDINEKKIISRPMQCTVGTDFLFGEKSTKLLHRKKNVGNSLKKKNETGRKE